MHAPSVFSVSTAFFLRSPLPLLPGGGGPVVFCSTFSLIHSFVPLLLLSFFVSFVPFPFFCSFGLSFLFRSFVNGSFLFRYLCPSFVRSFVPSSSLFSFAPFSFLFLFLFRFFFVFIFSFLYRPFFATSFLPQQIGERLCAKLGAQADNGEVIDATEAFSEDTGWDGMKGEGRGREGGWWGDGWAKMTIRESSTIDASCNVITTIITIFQQYFTVADVSRKVDGTFDLIGYFERAFRDSEVSPHVGRCSNEESERTPNAKRPVLCCGVIPQG